MIISGKKTVGHMLFLPCASAGFCRLAAVRRAPLWFVVSGVKVCVFLCFSVCLILFSFISGLIWCGFFTSLLWQKDGMSMMGDEIDYMKEPLQQKMQEQPHDADTAVALLSLFLESNLNEMKLGEGDTQVEMYCAAKSYIFEVSMGILQVFLNFRL
jgi:hypothetical protein